jgi:hypothetical protein
MCSENPTGHWILPSPSSITSHLQNLILYIHYVIFWRSIFALAFQQNLCMHFMLLPVYACHMPHPSHLSCFYYSYNIDCRANHEPPHHIFFSTFSYRSLLGLNSVLITLFSSASLIHILSSDWKTKSERDNHKSTIPYATWPGTTHNTYQNSCGLL